MACRKSLASCSSGCRYGRSPYKLIACSHAELSQRFDLRACQVMASLLNQDTCIKPCQKYHLGLSDRALYHPLSQMSTVK